MLVYIESLGCARNQVDSETMAGLLCQSGGSLTDDPAEAEVIVVNTCSFVASAIDESIDTILALAGHKQSGRCRKLVVAGCLPERFREEIVEALPEVDQFLGTGAFTQINAAVAETSSMESCLLPDPDRIVMDAKVERQREAGEPAYLKIAEGCSRHCTYCIIPKLRGRQKSRPLDQVLDEARQMADQGVREINLVAQDTTAYNRDRDGQPGLDLLLARLAETVPDTWIRFLYGHPESISEAVIQTVAAHDNLCPYFDLPVQHAAAPILKTMGRETDPARMMSLLQRIRQQVPGAALRTTLIVGFPGETDEHFAELVDFVEQVQFDHLGVFTYSDAEDLPSHGLPGHVAPELAQQRHDIIMQRQMEISATRLGDQVGQSVPVLVETCSEPGLYEGRTMLQAPEVDGLTFVRSDPDGPALLLGQPVDVRIVESLEYDLVGEVV